MIPRLVPYTGFRHAVPALAGAAAGLCAWWTALAIMVAHHATWGADVATRWSQEAEGAVLLCTLSAGAVAGTLVLEGAWIAAPWRRRWAALGIGAWVAMSVTFLVVLGWAWVAWVGDWFPASSLALRARLVPWLGAGLGAGLGVAAVRAGRHALHDLQLRWELWIFDPPLPATETRGEIVREALVSGLLAGALGAVGWYAVGIWANDLHLAGAFGAALLGAGVGGLTYGLPETAWRPWVLVRVGARPGWRVPLDPFDTALQERFVGSFPSGMDVHLPAVDGVDALHVSVLARPGHAYAVRGLSQRPVLLRRFMERVDLGWDPELPAPFEAPLRHEDVLEIGDVVDVELLVLPRDGAP